MCFSEEASFTAAAVLSLASVACFRKSRGIPALFALSAIPLFFAIQQFSEGVEWLYFKNMAGTEELSVFARNLFLFIALVIWPIWIPFSFYKAEIAPRRQRILQILVGLGFILGAYNGWKLFFYPVHAEVAYRSIQYYVDVPSSQIWVYGLTVIAPWFVSSLPRSPFLGGIFLFAAIVVGYIYFGVFISVWCFFSALVSSGLIYMLSDEKISHYHPKDLQKQRQRKD